MTPTNGVPLTAFLGTDYVVIDEEREIVVRIDRASQELDALLTRHGARHGVFITGWNPFSRAQPAATNAAANRRLAARFAARGVRTLPHVGRAREGGWAEEGFFAFDLDRDEAVAIAESFGQFAVVLAPRGAPAKLILTRLADPAAATS